MRRQHLGTCVLPSAAQNVANGRRWLLGRLVPMLGAAHGACEDSVLLLSETLTNAIVHGKGELVEVDVYLDAANVRIEVTDDGGGTDPHYVDDPHGEHGRGLPILVQLSRSWGFEHLDDGRLRVWFEVSHTGGSPPSPGRHDGSREEPSAPSAATVHPVDR